MNTEIKVEGLKELQEKLGLAVAQQTIEGPMEKSAYFLQAWSQKNRLSGPRPNILGVVTNRLRSSLSVSRSIKRGEFSFFIGTNVEYARQHEFGGTFNKISKKGKSFTATYPARPFLRPAIENQDNINKITASINKSISDALSK
jgi:phage gpG-like protein